MRTRRTGVGFALRLGGAVALLGACGPTADDGAAFGDDSSGDVVRELRLGEGVRLEPDGVLLTAVVEIAPAPGGGLLVIDRGTPGVLRLGPAGAHLGTLGRRGSGPGEFEALRHVGAWSDTIWALDVGLRRATLFAPSGELLGTFHPVTDAGLEEVIRGPALAGMVGRSVLVAGTVVDADSVVFLALPPEGRGFQEMLRIDAGPRWWNLEAPGLGPVTTSMHQPFAPYDLVAAGRDALVRVERPEPTAPERGSYTVTWIEPSSAGWTTTVTYAPVPLTEARVEAALDAWASSGIARMLTERAGLTEAAARRVAREALVTPEFLPPVPNTGSGIDDHAVRVGQDGTVWIRRQEVIVPGRGKVWEGVGPTGVVARLTVPDSARPRLFLEDEVVATVLDPLDVPTIVRYAVVPARR